jgi:enoyl-CoA hydratase/carnithine racemase
MAVRERLAIARAAATLPEEEAWPRSNAASASIRTTQEFQEGPRAFVEKRAPNWTGR